MLSSDSYHPARLRHFRLFGVAGRHAKCKGLFLKKGTSPSGSAAVAVVVLASCLPSGRAMLLSQQQPPSSHCLPNGPASCGRAAARNFAADNR